MKINAPQVMNSQEKTDRLQAKLLRPGADRQVTSARSLYLLITRFNKSESEARQILHLPVE